MFDIRQLRLITALAQEGTAAAVAAKLGFSAAAVSQQLASMSKIAGHPLTRKEGRRLVLTSSGQRLAQHAEEILAAMTLMEAEVTGAAAGSRLQVAAFPSGGRRFVVPALAELMGTAPNVEVRVTEAEPELALPLLKDGRVDIAVMYSYNLMPWRPDAGLVPMPLADQVMSFVCDDKIAARLRHGLARSGRALQDLPWVAGPMGSDDREVLRRVCATIGFEPRVLHTVDDYSLTETIVAAGLGVAIVPLGTFSGTAHRLRTFPLPGSAPVRHVWAVIQRGHERRQLIAEALEALASAATETAAIS